MKNKKLVSQKKIEDIMEQLVELLKTGQLIIAYDKDKGQTTEIEMATSVCKNGKALQIGSYNFRRKFRELDPDGV